MGLSATQMRFLCVTARKSNVEYQGQQINQSRTILANQAADIATELGNLTCPTAPSTYKYVINPITSDDVKVDWSKESEPADMDKFEAYYAANQAQFKDFNIPQYDAVTTDKDGKFTTITSGGITYNVTYNDDGSMTGTYTDSKTGEVSTLNIQVPFAYSASGKKNTGTSDAPNYVDCNYWKLYIPEGTGYSYNAKDNMFHSDSGDDNDLPCWLTYYNAAVANYNQYSQMSEKGTVNLIYDEETTPAVESDATGSVRTTTVSTSEAQYAAAYAQYERDLEAYNQRCAELEQKTKEVQEVDRKLELQMKQLETEREAINTEYESLQKVIQKNIEQTYKAFNA